jgi:pyruvate-formate lyase-activating enzyme
MSGNVCGDGPGTAVQITFYGTPLRCTSDQNPQCSHALWAPQCHVFWGSILVTFASDAYEADPILLQEFLRSLGLQSLELVYEDVLVNAPAPDRRSSLPDLAPRLFPNLRYVGGSVVIGTLPDRDTPSDRLMGIPGLQRLSYIGGNLMLLYTAFADLRTFSGLACVGQTPGFLTGRGPASLAQEADRSS